MVAFDFDGALNVARLIQQLAVTLTSVTNEHNPLRDDALQAWQGPVGEEFKLIRDAHDRKLDGLANELIEDAQKWVDAWAKAANDTNTESYEKARELQREIDPESLAPAEPRRVQRPYPPGFRVTTSPFAAYHLENDRYRLTYQETPTHAS